MRADNVMISFRYKKHKEAEWHNIVFTAEEFFDLRDRKPAERIDIYFVEKYLDFRKYIDVPCAEISTIEVQIDDPAENSQRFEQRCYWNHGK